MALDWNKVGPDTKVSDLTAGELLDLIGWALTQYRAGEQGDVTGFTFTGFSPNLPPLGPAWKTFRPRYWGQTYAARKK